MEKKKLPALQVDVKNVKPLLFGEEYESRMILDHVITGRDDVIQINHGTVKAGYALGGGVHEADEIYYILSGNGKCQLDDDIIDVHADMVIFIPAGTYHALDNSQGTEDMTILTFWKNHKDNESYEKRVEAWGVAYREVEDK